MTHGQFPGYAGYVLRVDLSSKKYERIPLSVKFIEKYIGGTGFGAKFLYEEVLPGVQWHDPENRVVIASGPLGGTRVSGSGSCSIVSKGPMTKQAGTSQANGFFGAYLKFSGVDALIIQGKSEKPCQVVIKNGKAEFFGAENLRGLDTIETEKRILKEGKYHKNASVMCIGPAAERGVRFSVLVADKGHVASKNGLGAVFAAKNLKALVTVKGKCSVQVKDNSLLKGYAIKLLEAAKNFKGGAIHKWGTAGIVKGLYETGQLPIKNYTTNIFPDHKKLYGQTLRATMELRRKRCWACGLNHLHYVKVLEGPYAGFEAEEPEYECVAAFGSLIGQTDLGAVTMLSDLSDRLGMDVNEIGWIVAWVMECRQEGFFSAKDVDGLDMKWGNVAATKALIVKIAYREGIGDLLADGLMVAAEKIGGKAKECAIYTLKGATPRGHDHRVRWAEMLDTCLSTTSTVEAQAMGGPQPELFGFQPVKDKFDPLEIAGANALVNGYRIFEDSLGICNFNSVDPQLTIDCVNAITGWSINLKHSIWVGRRIVHILRMFNLRHGQDITKEVPSKRYASQVTDGQWQGKFAMVHWDDMRKKYYNEMGWDVVTGWPLQESLQKFDLNEYAKDLPDTGTF